MIIALAADVTIMEYDGISDSRIDMILHKPTCLEDFRKLLAALSEGPDTHPVKETDARLPEADVNAVRELVELVGVDKTRGLLHATARDIDRAIKAMRRLDPKIADIAHYAAGSTAALGLLEINACLRDIELSARANNTHKVITAIDLLEQAAQIAQKTITLHIASLQP